jgi:hypothetical protein
MPRPERPVEGHGPVPQLARELRKIRGEAGTPGYRKMAAAVTFSVETLSAAARGTSCPSWEVTKAFADACDPNGAAARGIRPMWVTASRASRRRRPTARHRPEPAAPRQAVTAGPHPDDGRPQPDPGGTPAQYVHGLRTLRAWAGSPSRHEAKERLGNWWTLPSSTMYDAISPKRTTLPPLRTVKSILMACLDDQDAVEEWVSAWRAIRVREFTSANPVPAGEPSDGGGRAALRVVSGQ